MEERLQKVMAQSGVASRRKCEEMITAGRVSVNGEIVKALGTKVDAAVDEILVNGRALRKPRHIYVLLHKPKGVISSVTDPEGRKVVVDYVKNINERLFPVGRLDYDSEGLLLMTNDGDFMQRLTHPKYHVPKMYYVWVKGVPNFTSLEAIRHGMEIEDGRTAPAEADYLDVEENRTSSLIRVTLYEGRNRQIRKMFEKLGHPVTRLKRVAYGSLTLEGVRRGAHRLLQASEVKELLAMTDSKKKHKIVDTQNSNIE